MITDEKKNIRELGYRRILKARGEANKDQLRQFAVPTLNFEAEEYYELINWQKISITEPPLTAGISDEDLQRFALSGDPPVFQVPRYFGYTLSHTGRRKMCKVGDGTVSVCDWSRRKRRIYSCYNRLKKLNAQV